MGASYLSKVTMAGIGLTSGILDKTVCDKPVIVARIYGFINGSETVNSTLGQSVRFNGEIEAQNLLTDELFRSGKMFVPAVGEIALTNELGSMAEGDKLKFGMEISIERNTGKGGGVKYKYSVRPLIEMKQNDALSEMRLALPAPGAKIAKKK